MNNTQPNRSVVVDSVSTIRSALNLLSFKTLTQSDPVINLRDRLFHCDRLVQAGKTPFTIIKDDIQPQGLIQLRYYPPLDGYPTLHRVPIVIVPPLAVNMLIYDLFKDRSLIRFLLEQGYAVYMLDWGAPTREHCQFNFDNYILDFMPKLLARVRQHSGQQQLTLHNWSLSGIFALLYVAATQDPHIKNLIILGTPLNPHLSGMLGRQVHRVGVAMSWLENHIHRHPRKIAAKYLHSGGWLNTFGFNLLNISGTLKSQISLLRQLDNRRAVESHATHSAFLNHMVDYPGGVNRDMFIHVWMDNGLAQGEFSIGGKQVYLSNVHASLLIGAGRSDSMVTVDAAYPLTQLTGSTDVTFTTLSGGHIGIIANQDSAKVFWPMMSEWLGTRSD
jgi:polyhydroxyalkanoate synthase